MTLTLELTPTEEAQLKTAARQKGVDPAVFLKQLMTEHLPEPAASPESLPEDPTLALFAQWAKEDAQMTPEELAEENRTWEEFKSNINDERDRAGARRVF